MMHLQPVLSDQSDVIFSVFQHYSTTFPEDERRDWAGFLSLLENKNATIALLKDRQKTIGYMVYWTLPFGVFIEHFEIYAEFRNRNYGTQFLSLFQNKFPNIVLEIEPTDQNTLAKMRFDFYKKNEFAIVDRYYKQPSYTHGGLQIPLWLMANFYIENKSNVISEIHEIVYHTTA